MSRAVLTARISICRPMAEPAACTSLVKDSALGLVGLTSTAKRSTFGRRSSSSPSRLAASSAFWELIPVTFPPGWLKLATSPNSTGSVPTLKTTGIDVVAALAASAAGVLPRVTITATRRRTRSATSSGSRALSLYAKRNSTITLRPSTKPVSPRPLRNAATIPVLSSGAPG